LNRQKICKVCNGVGSAKPEDVHTCDDCRGSGAKVVRKMLAPGFVQQMQIHCNKCDGSGKVFKSKCSHCHGRRVIREKEEIKFDIPAGANEGHVIVF
jgi:DnaJ-class molecular chaperone